jgi:hypothetical protein
VKRGVDGVKETGRLGGRRPPAQTARQQPVHDIAFAGSIAGKAPFRITQKIHLEPTLTTLTLFE